MTRARYEGPRSKLEAKLLDETYLSPDDDAPRRRYGDFLVERQEVFGDFVRDQLASADVREQTRKRQEIYFRQASRFWPGHPAHWFAPVQIDDVERGFPFRVRVPYATDASERSNALAAWCDLAEHPGWQTVRELVIDHRWGGELCRFIRRPRVRRIPSIHGVGAAALAALGDLMIPTKELGFVLDESGAPFVAGFPELERLAVQALVPRGSFILEQLEATGLVGRVSRLAIGCPSPPADWLATVADLHAALPASLATLTTTLASGASVTLGHGPRGVEIDMKLTPARGRERDHRLRELQALRPGAARVIRVEFSQEPYRGCREEMVEACSIPLALEVPKPLGGYDVYLAADESRAADAAKLCDRLEGSGWRCFMLWRDRPRKPGNILFHASFVRAARVLVVHSTGEPYGKELDAARRFSVPVLSARGDDRELLSAITAKMAEVQRVRAFLFVPAALAEERAELRAALREMQYSFRLPIEWEIHELGQTAERPTRRDLVVAVIPAQLARPLRWWVHHIDLNRSWDPASWFRPRGAGVPLVVRAAVDPAFEQASHARRRESLSRDRAQVDRFERDWLGGPIGYPDDRFPSTSGALEWGADQALDGRPRHPFGEPNPQDRFIHHMITCGANAHLFQPPPTPAEAIRRVRFAPFGPRRVAAGGRTHVQIWGLNPAFHNIGLIESELGGMGGYSDRGLRWADHEPAPVCSIPPPPLKATLTVPSLGIRSASSPMRLDAEPTSGWIPLILPPSAPEGAHPAFLILWCAGVPVAHVAFDVEVGTPDDKIVLWPSQEEPVRQLMLAHAAEDAALFRKVARKGAAVGVRVVSLSRETNAEREPSIREPLFGFLDATASRGDRWVKERRRWAEAALGSERVIAVAGAGRASANDLIDLVRRYVGGDRFVMRQALTALSRPVRKAVASVLARGASGRRISRQEIADHTQSVLIALFADRARAILAWDPSSGTSFKAFVGLLAEREAAKLVRERRRARTRRASKADAKQRPIVEAGIIRRETVDKIAEVLRSRLGPEERELFELIVGRGLSPEEAGRVANLGVEEVERCRRSWARQADALLRELQS